MLNGETRAGDWVVAAAGWQPGDLLKLWETPEGSATHIEFGFSCMGHEIPAALGIRMHEGPQGEVFVVLGDGSYLMQPTELVTAVQERLKLTVVLIDNGGYGSIDGLARESGHVGRQPLPRARRRRPLPGRRAGRRGLRRQRRQHGLRERRRDDAGRAARGARRGARRRPLDGDRLPGGGTAADRRRRAVGGRRAAGRREAGPMSGPRLRTGVLGCGLIAQVVHLPLLRELEQQFEVVAPVRSSPRVRERGRRAPWRARTLRRLAPSARAGAARRGCRLHAQLHARRDRSGRARPSASTCSSRSRSASTPTTPNGSPRGRNALAASCRSGYHEALRPGSGRRSSSSCRARRRRCG